MKTLKSEKGMALMFAVLLMLVSLMLIPALVTWLQNDARWTVKQEKTTAAFHLAEAGIDRAVYKLKSSTVTWAQAAAGTTITGYNFDDTYDDIEGGYYRVLFSSGPGLSEVTVTSEGKDSQSKEVRCLKAIYSNQAVNAAMLTTGLFAWKNGLTVHWGKVMAHDDIDISDSNAAKDYFPRKYSRQVVSGHASYPRDTNGLTPPNTDNIEWWTDYDVPDLPLLDFTTLRSSAIANGTWNIYGCKGSGAAWDTNPSCTGSDHSEHFGASHLHSKSKQNLYWYWDGNVMFTGKTAGKGIGLYGTIIIRGDMSVQSNAEDDYAFTGDVPEEAYEEYTKITSSTNDSASIDQYPADNGLRTNRSTFGFGTETWTGCTSQPTAAESDVGFRGFVYVGDDCTLDGKSNDFYGALWIVGDLTKAVGNTVYVYYNEDLSIPTLNVVLTQESWEEIGPSSTAWVAP